MSGGHLHERPSRQTHVFVLRLLIVERLTEMIREDVFINIRLFDDDDCL